MRQSVIGLMGMRRSRKTGLPAVKYDRGDYLDEATFQKRRENNTLKLCQKAFGKSENEIKSRHISFDIKDITKQNDWIAIIHADGNGIGNIVKKVGKDMQQFSEFSKKLNTVTIDAAVEAYNQIIKKEETTGRIPLRPVVLGGDDLTVIIRGDLALPYVTAFIRSFEDGSRREFSKYLGKGRGLTACAGIAYIKSSYPFYYGYELAETLCTRAKKTAKTMSEIAPSCVMTHKIQDSFVEDFDSIADRELEPCEGYSFEFGPYFIDEKCGFWTVDDLLCAVSKLSTDEGNALKSHIRKWLSVMHNEGPDKAKQMSDRVLKRLEDNPLAKLASKLFEGEKREGKIVYPAYDVLSICSITNLITR
jgi:hypothetical protein